jgi:hypothetical protein
MNFNNLRSLHSLPIKNKWTGEEEDDKRTGRRRRTRINLYHNIHPFLFYPFRNWERFREGCLGIIGDAVFV